MKQRIQLIETFRVIAISAMVSLLSMQVDAGSLNDPTRPPLSRAVTKTTVSTPTGSRLTAILYSGERRVAVIDGKAVREGDRLADAIVSHIAGDSVTLTKANRAEILRLPKSTLSIRSKSAMEGQP